MNMDDIIETRPVRLKGINILEVSAVDVGANPMASITITKRATPPDSAPVTKADIRPARMAQKRAPVSLSEDHMSEFTKAQAAETTIDVLIAKRLETHEDETEATAAVKVLETDEGRRLYGQMVYNHDVAVAKVSTLLTFGNRTDTKKVGGHSTAEREAATGAWAQLDKLAKEHAAATNQPFHQAYAQVIGTKQGKALYAAGCAKPSAARAGSGQNEDANFPRAQIAAA